MCAMVVFGGLDFCLISFSGTYLQGPVDKFRKKSSSEKENVSFHQKHFIEMKGHQKGKE